MLKHLTGQKTATHLNANDGTRIVVVSGIGLYDIYNNFYRGIVE